MLKASSQKYFQMKKVFLLGARQNYVPKLKDLIKIILYRSLYRQGLEFTYYDPYRRGKTLSKKGVSWVWH